MRIRQPNPKLDHRRREWFFKTVPALMKLKTKVSSCSADVGSGLSSTYLMHGYTGLFTLDWGYPKTLPSLGLIYRDGFFHPSASFKILATTRKGYDPKLKELALSGNPIRLKDIPNCQMSDMIDPFLTYNGRVSFNPLRLPKIITSIRSQINQMFNGNEWSYRYSVEEIVKDFHHDTR